MQRDGIHGAYWSCQTGGDVMVISCMYAAKHIESVVCVKTIKRTSVLKNASVLDLSDRCSVMAFMGHIGCVRPRSP